MIYSKPMVTICGILAEREEHLVEEKKRYG